MTLISASAVPQRRKGWGGVRVGCPSNTKRTKNNAVTHKQQTMLLHVSYGKWKRLTRVRYGTPELCVISTVKRSPDQISLCSQRSPFVGSGRLDLYYGLIRITILHVFCILGGGYRKWMLSRLLRPLLQE